MARLISLIATLRTVMRLPVRQIQDLLQTLHGVQVSVGEIVEVLHRLVAYAQPQLDDLKAQVRASPAVQADETGWREDGLNGYIWSVGTPTIRFRLSLNSFEEAMRLTTTKNMFILCIRPIGLIFLSIKKTNRSDTAYRIDAKGTRNDRISGAAHSHHYME